MVMNEFTAGVLGEAMAFSKFGKETITNNKDVFAMHMSEEDMNFSLDRINGHEEAIQSYIKDKGIESDVLSVSKKTEEQLKVMRDACTGEDHNMSVLNWWSFFGGAVLAHWNMVKGVFETLEDDAMVAVAYDAIGYHEDIYDSVTEALTEMARKNSKQ